MVQYLTDAKAPPITHGMAQSHQNLVLIQIQLSMITKIY